MAPSKKTNSTKGAKKGRPKEYESCSHGKDVIQEVAPKDSGRARPVPQSARAYDTLLPTRGKAAKKTVPDIESPSLRIKDLAPLLKAGVAEVHNVPRLLKPHPTEDDVTSSEETVSEGLKDIQCGVQEGEVRSSRVTLPQTISSRPLPPSAFNRSGKAPSQKHQSSGHPISQLACTTSASGRPKAIATGSSPGRPLEERTNIETAVPNLERRDYRSLCLQQDVGERKRALDVIESSGHESMQDCNVECVPSEGGHISVLDEIEAERLAVKRVDKNTWTSNPSTVPFVEEDVPDFLESKIIYKKDRNASSKEHFKQMLQANLISNREFEQKASYMFIFGPNKYFQLRVEDMVNSNPESCTIVRPLEEEGVSKCLKRMVRLNFSKQILTVMPNTRTRPQDWMECVRAGKFKIINGQHTWKAAERIVQKSNVDVDDESIVDRARQWICEVVWSAVPDHLHALSYKCNEGNEELPFLSTLIGTICHCRSLWLQKGRPQPVRKNNKSKPGSEAEKNFVSYQDFIRLCIESYMGTGVARQSSKKASVFDFSKLGEKLIFMGSDFTFSKWDECFAAMEEGGLYDIDSGCLFKDKTSKEKDDEIEKPVLTGTMLRPMAGFHDIYVRHLALALMKKPPTVCLTKPKSWSRAQGILEWCTRKKFKSYLCKLLSIASTTSGIQHNDFMTDFDVVKPQSWRHFKAAVYMNGMHFDAMIAEADPSFINQKILRKNSDVPIPVGLTQMTKAVVVNHERYEDIMSEVDAVAFLYNEDRLSFATGLYKWEKKEKIMYEGRAAQARDCEAGIIDFQFFPGDSECKSTRKINDSLKDVMYELGKSFKTHMQNSVKTWMLIFFHPMKETVESIMRKYFPQHILKRGGKYVRAQGEAKFGVTWVWYLQNPSAKRRPKQFGDFSAELREIGLEEDVLTMENTPLEHRYKKRSEYRNEHRLTQDDFELRMELYLRFIDTFTHFQACVMLVFAGFKAVAACTSLGRSSVSAITSEIFTEVHSHVVDLGAEMWPEFYVPSLKYTYQSCLDHPNVKIIPRSVQQDSIVPEEPTDKGVNGSDNEEVLKHNVEDDEEFSNLQVMDMEGESQVLATEACILSPLRAASSLLVNPIASTFKNGGDAIEVCMEDDFEKEEPLLDKRQARRLVGSGPRSSTRSAHVDKKILQGENSKRQNLEHQGNEGVTVDNSCPEDSDVGRNSDLDDEMVEDSSGRSIESESDDVDGEQHVNVIDDNADTILTDQSNAVDPALIDSNIQPIERAEAIVERTITSAMLAMDEGVGCLKDRILNVESNSAQVSTVVASVARELLPAVERDVALVEPTTTSEPVSNSSSKLAEVCTRVSTMIGLLPSNGHEVVVVEPAAKNSQVRNGNSELGEVSSIQSNKPGRVLVRTAHEVNRHDAIEVIDVGAKMDKDREVIPIVSLDSPPAKAMSKLEVARAEIEKHNHLLQVQEKKLQLLQNKVENSIGKEVEVIDLDDMDDEILEMRCSVDNQLLDEHKRMKSQCLEVSRDSKEDVKPIYANHMEKALLAIRKQVRDQVEETILVNREKKARRQKKKAEQEAMNKALRTSMKKQEKAMAILIAKVASLEGSQSPSETLLSGVSTPPMAVSIIPPKKAGAKEQEGTQRSSAAVSPLVPMEDEDLALSQYDNQFHQRGRSKANCDPYSF